MEQEAFDIVILGAGASGLLCALQCLDTEMSVLILEQDAAKNNDRTWCFWERGTGPFDSIVQASWDQIDVHGFQSYERLNLGDYKYKMIRSQDFYQFAKSKINRSSNITISYESVIDVIESQTDCLVKTDAHQYKAKFVLDSFRLPDYKASKKPFTLQHFLGFYISFNTPVFESRKATLMDFRIAQEQDTRFMYVLPSNDREALVELAIFSKNILKKATYRSIIKAYIEQYISASPYDIKEEEFGVIPMSSYPFHKHDTTRVIKIGTAGGWVKPSTGYAFKRCMDRSEQLIMQIQNKRSIQTHSSPFYQWVDQTFLNAIENEFTTGKQIFDNMFSKRTPEQIFAFLDEQSTLSNTLQVMLSCPFFPFIRAALR